jgi:hypothetical protein
VGSSDSFKSHLGSFTKALFDLCETVVEARSFLQEEEYEKILRMNREHLFEFNSFHQLKSHDEKWTTRVLSTVKEEVTSLPSSFSFDLWW